MTTIIGLAAAVLTSTATLPQAIKSFKTKKTEDISLFTFLMALSGTVLWLIYGLAEGDLPIILANTVSFLIMFTIFIMKLKYG